MKLKKLLHSLTSFVTIFALTSGIIVTYAPAGAEDLTVDDIKSRIEQIKQDNEQRREEIDRIQGDITDKQEDLDNTAKLLAEQKELVDYYYNLVYYKNQDIDSLQGDIDTLTDEIAKKDEAIATAEKNIDKLDKENKANLEKFAQIVRTMYTSGTGDMFGVLAGSTDFYDLMINSEVVGKISEQNLQFMNDLTADMKKLSSDKKLLETDKADLEQSKKQLDSQMTKLLSEKQELDGLVSDAESAKSTYESDYNKYSAAVSDLEDQKSNLQYEISVSEADIEAYEEQIKELIKQQTNPDKVYQEGEWYWPVPGRSYISCNFGWDADFGRWHKGVDIGDGGIYGDSILASKAGTVIVAETSYIPGYSYGMYVVVDHGGGYTTTYAHMSAVYVSVGQEVAQGEALGAVGSTGYSTGPHLHFEIRLNGEPENPFNYVTMA
ncbi:MAG: peptidoglycan DD-metalloendopeptidase family protein [Ruminiclostridium sp.]|nr:peptidoglycan DD-metalloendopeptidase family protein [Ruminiclostridium sp.]